MKEIHKTAKCWNISGNVRHQNIKPRKKDFLHGGQAVPDSSNRIEWEVLFFEENGALLENRERREALQGLLHCAQAKAQKTDTLTHTHRGCGTALSP